MVESGSFVIVAEDVSVLSEWLKSTWYELYSPPIVHVIWTDLLVVDSIVGCSCRSCALGTASLPVSAITWSDDGADTWGASGCREENLDSSVEGLGVSAYGSSDYAADGYPEVT